MRSYLINCGDFNVIVRPEAKAYHLASGEDGLALEEKFLTAARMDYSGYPSSWFSYSGDEKWSDFEGKDHGLAVTMEEEALIDLFVLKKNNYGGLVAIRDEDTGKVRTFKPAKLSASRDSSAR